MVVKLWLDEREEGDKMVGHGWGSSGGGVTLRLLFLPAGRTVAVSIFYKCSRYFLRSKELLTIHQNA